MNVIVEWKKLVKVGVFCLGYLVIVLVLFYIVWFKDLVVIFLEMYVLVYGGYEYDG